MRFSLLLFATIPLSSTDCQTKCSTVLKYWCGKPYIPKNLLIERNILQLETCINQYQCSKEMLMFDSTAQNETIYIGTFQSKTPPTIRLPPVCDPIPLIPDLIITVATAISTIAVKVLLCDGTEILAMTKINIEGNSIELPFSLANIKPKLAAYNVIILFYIEDNNILVHTTYAKLYFLPVGPKTVKIDRLYGGILTSANETIFPVGPYVDI
ncbi:18374_t:CDS:2, partial [Gigaspora rosea]